MEISSSKFNQVLFRVENLLDIASSSAGVATAVITAVYFDDGTILGLAGLNDNDDGIGGDPDVDFSPSDNDNLPSGVNVGFVATAGFNVDANPSPAHNGVVAGDFLDIIFDLKEDSGVLQTYEDVIEDLASGALRIGLHVQSLPLAYDAGNRGLGDRRE